MHRLRHENHMRRWHCGWKSIETIGGITSIAIGIHFKLLQMLCAQILKIMDEKEKVNSF